jgi:hypothetical protein
MPAFFRALLCTLPLLLLMSCSSTKTNQTADRVAAYRAVLAKYPEPALTPGSAAEQTAIARFKGYLGNITPETVRTQTKTVYSADAYFDDTLKVLHGAAEIEPYLLRTAEMVTSFKVEFLDVARSGPDYYFRWVMDFSAPKLAKGEVLRTIGITQVRFNEDGQVVLHQDFWDAANGIYEHIPLVGGAIRAIKKRF